MRSSSLAPENVSIYVISLKRRSDRKEKIEAQLAGFPDCTFCYHIGGVFDHAQMPSLPAGVELFPWEIQSSNRWWNRPLKMGEVACTLNHLASWRDASKRGLSAAVFLEDDAVLRGGWPRVAEAISEIKADLPSWDLLYLGREPCEPDYGRAGKYVRPGFSFGTWGYALSSQGLKKVLNYDLEHAIIPADEFLPATYLAHPRRDVAKRFPPKVSAFALEEDIVVEGEKLLYGSDTEDSHSI